MVKIADFPHQIFNVDYRFQVIVIILKGRLS